MLIKRNHFKKEEMFRLVLVAQNQASKPRVKRLSSPIWIVPSQATGSHVGLFQCSHGGGTGGRGGLSNPKLSDSGRWKQKHREL